MKKNCFFSMMAMSFFLLQVTSCGKIENILQKPTEPYKMCNVSKLTFKLSATSQPQTFDFTYNSHGNPHNGITIPQSEILSEYFYYDKQNRLTDFITTINPLTGDTLPASFGFLIYTKYTYNNNRKELQPVADTFHSFGRYENGVVTRSPTGPYKDVTNYEYDAEGRIIKTINRYNEQTVGRETFYTYDAQGNLIRPGLVYDNKVNVNRTNAVWMLINKDYSRNNPFVAETYNSYGLPEKISNGYVRFLGTNFPIATFSYTCDAK